MLKKIAAFLGLAMAATALAAGVSGCGSSAPDPTYAPAAYYQTVGGVNDCYYIDDIYEVAALKSAGLCPSNAEAVLMPIVWQETYWAYYSSPAYYNTYIPLTYRTHYTTVYVHTFSTRYGSQITHYSATARYRSSTGSIVTGGSGVSKMKFSTGNGVTSGHGGGSGRTSGCAESLTVVHMRGGSSGGGHGGGPGRSSTGSGTTTRSGTGTGHSGSGC